MENGADAAGGGIIEINNNTAATTKLTWTLFKAVCFSSLGGILFGYGMFILSPSFPANRIDTVSNKKSSMFPFFFDCVFGMTRLGSYIRCIAANFCFV